MKLILQYLSEKIQELKSNNELKLAALSGFTFGVLFVAVMYNIYWVYKSRSRHQRLLMKNLILLFLLIPNLVMGGLNQNKTPEPVEGNPFEFLKELVDGLSEGGGYDVEENDSGLSNEVLKPKANQELYPKANQELYEKARVEYLIKMIFPHDIEGAKEIFADPDLKKIDPLYLSQTIRRKMNLVNDKICENNQMDFLPPTLDKIYEAGTQYRFILELGTFNFLFEDYNVSFLEKAEDAIWEDKDIKLKPVLDGEGLLSINLETQIIKS